MEFLRINHTSDETLEKVLTILKIDKPSTCSRIDMIDILKNLPNDYPISIKQLIEILSVIGISLNGNKRIFLAKFNQWRSIQ